MKSNKEIKEPFGKSFTKTDDIKKYKVVEWLEIIPEYVMDEIKQSIRKETIKQFEQLKKAWDLDHNQLVVKNQQLKKDIERLKELEKKYDELWAKSGFVYGENQVLKSQLNSQTEKIKKRIEELEKELKPMKIGVNCDETTVRLYCALIEELKSLLENEKDE
jgi:transcriptional regulator of heat shock response